MDPYIGDWLDLIVRWTHVITGIAWIGSSFFFMWLDARMTPPRTPRPRVEGELWLVHGGGFYQIEKIEVAPDAIPRELHWFKWEAGFTWITGMLLLVIVYYLGAEVFMVDAGARLGPGAAVAVGLGVLILSWPVYDLLWQSRLGRAGAPATAISLVLAVAVAYGLAQLVSGRAAYIHVGAMLGTLMVGNVWMRIIPAQRQLVAARQQGTAPDAARAVAAKQRSVHNNYMTLPVIFVMIGSHYPGTYGHAYNWLILAAVFVVGASVRHFFNLRNEGRGRTGLWYLAGAALVMVAVIYAAAPRQDPAPATEVAGAAGPVAFREVREVIRHRCVVCHSASPTNESFDVAPADVKFDSPEQIKHQAARIYARAVISKTMPLGDPAGMTQEERDLLARWVRQGAALD